MPTLMPASSYLLQSSNAGSQLSKAPPIAKGAVVAASGLLTVMLGLIQLPELFPQPRLHRVPEQRLYTAVQGFQLPMEGPWGRRPTEQKAFRKVRLGKAPSRLQPYPASEALSSLLTLEHNMVCWGAQSYCHVKGVGVLGWGAAQYWLSI